MSLIVRDRQSTLIERARHALVCARSVKQVKAIIDSAEAAELYARRQKLSDGVVGQAHALKIEALVKLGAMLKRMPKHVGGRPSKTGSTWEPLKLADIGIDKKTSMIAQQLAALPAKVRAAVASRDWSLREAVTKHRQATAKRPPLPEGKFRVIYADPPWPNLAMDQRSPNTYPTMSLPEICAMKVADLAGDDCALFMWATAPLLPDAFKVLEAWGFEYKTNITWDKQAHMFGHYLSTQHEHLLLATRGRCQPDRLLPLVPSVLRVKRTRAFKHSQKPEEARRLIERLYDPPYVELFARRLTPGWVTFGNDAALNGGKAA